MNQKKVNKKEEEEKVDDMNEKVKNQKEEKMINNK